MKATARSTFKTIDIVNKGNKTLWTKFANTLKLRMLIRQSQVAGFNPSAEIAKITGNGGVLQPGENIDVNPGYVNEANKQSPFYATYGNTPTGADASTSTRANDYFVNLLVSTIHGLNVFTIHLLRVVVLQEPYTDWLQEIRMAHIVLRWGLEWQIMLLKTSGYFLLLKACFWKLKLKPGVGWLVMLKHRMNQQ